MIRKKILRYLLLAALTLLLAGTPAAILAADLGGISAAHSRFLPVAMKAGAAGPADTLINGGTVEGPGSVGIGALTDTLDAPIQVSISVTTTPSTTVSPPAQVLGDFYQIGAGENVFVAPESPFILAFPLPAGASTANLALAVLQSGEWIADVDEGIEAWTFLEGMVDPDQELFLTTIAGLKKEGEIFTLVEHPDFASPPNEGSNGIIQVSGSLQFDLFTVHCVNFSNPTDCPETTENVVASYLSDVYAHIHQNRGFNAPRLRYMNETLTYDPHSYSVLGYSAYIEPVNSGECAAIGGYYDPATGRLVLCLDPLVGITTNSLEGLVHEYFHATQYSYLEVLADYLDGSQEPWVIEGMAASAMKSYSMDEMLRTDYFGGLHEVDVSLEFFGGPADLDEYRAQDFWVYYGQRNGLNLSYLEPILETGALSQSVVDVLGNGEVLDVYWDWVKNHVMEPGVDYNGLLGTPCELETQVVALVDDFDFIHFTNDTYDVVLDPLTSIVVKINWDKTYDFATGAVALGLDEPPEANLALRYKFYIQGETCETVPDGLRNLQNIDPSDDYYVVISNIDHDNAYSYRVRIFEYFPTSSSAP